MGVSKRQVYIISKKKANTVRSLIFVYDCLFWIYDNNDHDDSEICSAVFVFLSGHQSLTRLFPFFPFPKLYGKYITIREFNIELYREMKYLVP